jgi:hypothetical protein
LERKFNFAEITSLTFRAPNQTDLAERRSDWEVALMQVDEKSAILVLRGYWKDRLVEPQVAMSTGVDLARRCADRDNLKM